MTVRATQHLTGSNASRRLKAQQTFRLLGNVTDQGLSSLTNLLVSLFSAHLLRVEAFGVVSVVMTTYFVCVGVARAVCSCSIWFGVGSMCLAERSRRSAPLGWAATPCGPPLKLTRGTL